jgi:hypothetical protein
MRIRMFIVFHKAIDERLIFQPFATWEIDKYFTLYGVNADHPEKFVTLADGQRWSASAVSAQTVLEYELGWYDPTIQARGFLETSCYVHVLKNGLHEPFDYIGVTQYDMRWTNAAAAILRDLANLPAQSAGPAYGIVCGTLMDGSGEFHCLAFPALRNWDFLLASYNKYFGRHWDMRLLINKPLTLFQTYLLPKQEFVALARWIEVLCLEVYPWANQPPYETHWGTLGGYTERAESLFIAARLHEGTIELHHLALEHDPSIPSDLGVLKLHYNDRP